MEMRISRNELNASLKKGKATGARIASITESGIIKLSVFRRAVSVSVRIEKVEGSKVHFSLVGSRVLGINVVKLIKKALDDAESLDIKVEGGLYVMDIGDKMSETYGIDLEEINCEQDCLIIRANIF